MKLSFLFLLFLFPYWIEGKPTPENEVSNLEEISHEISSNIPKVKVCILGYKKLLLVSIFRSERKDSSLAH